MNETFVGKVAVVTGAARGIGRAIAEHLYAGGARVLLVDRNADGVVGTAQSMCALDGSKAHSLVADLADPASINALAGQICAFATKVDVLVNNAGIELDLPIRVAVGATLELDGVHLVVSDPAARPTAPTAFAVTAPRMSSCDTPPWLQQAALTPCGSCRATWKSMVS
jgi:NAD(P)-dependent dehydrogenase (short-subunit alcohol dehydrogenase family)